MNKATLVVAPNVVGNVFGVTAVRITARTVALLDSTFAVTARTSHGKMDEVAQLDFVQLVDFVRNRTMSAVEQFERSVHALLMTHYGIARSDTALGERTVCAQLVAQKVRAVQAVNAVAEKQELERIDKRGRWGMACYDPLTVDDETKVREAG